MAKRTEPPQMPVQLLEQLLALEYDADEIYRVASERVADPRYQESLAEFQAEHHRHREELEQRVRQLGGTVPAGPDLRGRLEESWVLLAQLGSDDAILKAMQANAERNGKAYEQALEQVPVELRDLLQRCRDAEWRHRDWFATAVKALESKPHRGVPPWNIPPPSGL